MTNSRGNTTFLDDGRETDTHDSHTRDVNMEGEIDQGTKNRDTQRNQETEHRPPQREPPTRDARSDQQTLQESQLDTIHDNTAAENKTKCRRTEPHAHRRGCPATPHRIDKGNQIDAKQTWKVV